MWKEYYNCSELTVTRKKLRNYATKHEKILWEEIKWKKLMWLKFRRQYSVWRYILDFYCSSIKIWIEIDWINHLEKEILDYDIIRTEYIESDWIKIYRFTNNEIENNIQYVLNKLKEAIKNN
jgi:very-short-patch-repair endonuclease